MKKTVNTSHVRSINQRAVLDAIFHKSSISKAELARMLHMSKPSMGDNVADLLQIGIIEEIGEGECGKGGGRKPVLLSFCDDFKYIVTMDFHYQHSFFALSNLRGRILNEFSIHQTPLSDFDAWITMCINAISTLTASQCIADSDLAAIAVSAPGILNVDEEDYIVSSKYGDFNVKIIEERLSRAFPVPILVKNSTNAAALGELYYGSGLGLKSIAYLSCGQGVGAGIIINEKLYEGRHMAAGEIGYQITPERLNTPGASLENRICIESILREVNESLPEDTRRSLKGCGEKVSFQDMISLWEAGDSFIRKTVDTLAAEIGCAVCNLISTLDCELVILGGDYLAFEGQLLPAVKEIVDNNCFLPVPVTASNLGGKASTLGLIATGREFYFKKICIRQ